MGNKRKTQSGYTLIEILAVAFIFVISGVIIAGIITSVLRSANKSRISDSVSKNGSYALSTISDLVISSTYVTNFAENTNDCRAASVAPPINAIKLTDATGNITTLSCEADTIASRSAAQNIPLTDISQVRIDTSTTTTCYFKCIQSEDIRFNAPIVEVGFTMTETSSSIAPEKRASAEFRTSVSPRNYIPQ